MLGVNPITNDVLVFVLVGGAVRVWLLHCYLTLLISAASKLRRFRWQVPASICNAGDHQQGKAGELAICGGRNRKINTLV